SRSGIYTLSLHDALPICIFSLWEVALGEDAADKRIVAFFMNEQGIYRPAASKRIWEELLKPECCIEMEKTQDFTPEQLSLLTARSEEHTSELQSRFDLVC